tara:strand:- start:10824 stop:12692 length:1869 start_codon:yes stop_codon:yes gene_type:complete
MQFLAELRRRNVFRVTAAYLVVGWLVMQVIAVIADAAALPDWADGLALILLLAGLPVALFIAWAFELTPDGLKPTESIDPATSLARATGSTLDIAILGGLALVVILVLGSWLMPNTAPAPNTESDLAAPAPDSEAVAVASSAPALSVAVLPFMAMSSNDDDRYFADGLTEEILNSLAALPDLLVTSRTSAFQFRGEDHNVPEIAAQLGVAHVVEGSVRRSGDQVRITVQLIRAADDSHVWSQTYDRTMEDVFAIQEDIATSIADVLDIVLDEAQRARMRNIGVGNVEAYIAYQRGVEIAIAAHGGVGSLVARLAPADALFELATELAPNFSDAYVQRADYYAHQTHVDAATGGAEEIAAAQAAADRYLELLDQAAATTDRSENRAMIAIDRLYFQDDWSGAGRILDRANQADGCPNAAWVSEMASISGRSSEFVAYAQRLVSCDPLNPQYWATLSGIARDAGEYDLALATAQSGLAIDTGNNLLMSQAGLTLLEAGPRAEFEEFLDDIRGPEVLRNFLTAMAAARDGDYEQAAALRDRTEGDFGFTGLVLHATLGERTEANARAAANDALPFGFHDLIQTIVICACGAPWDLEVTPNFARRLEQAGFPWPPQDNGNFPLKDW